MKKMLAFGLIVLLAWRLADVFGDLKITQQQAQEYVANDLLGNYFGFPNACRKIPVAQREAVVKTMGAFARAYVKTDDFKQRYAAWREEHKPRNEAKTWEQVQEEQKKQVAEMKKSVAEMKVNVKAMSADLRKTMEPVIAQQEQMIREMESGKSPMLMTKAQHEQMTAMMEQSHRQQLQQWETEYPVSPNRIIRQRLERFLEVSQGVDFSAKTAPDKYGKQRFVNPAYEQKDGYWKQCYRVGKGGTDAARALAQEWRAELGE